VLRVHAPTNLHIHVVLYTHTGTHFCRLGCAYEVVCDSTSQKRCEGAHYMSRTLYCDSHWCYCVCITSRKLLPLWVLMGKPTPLCCLDRSLQAVRSDSGAVPVAHAQPPHRPRACAAPVPCCASDAGGLAWAASTCAVSTAAALASGCGCHTGVGVWVHMCVCVRVGICVCAYVRVRACVHMCVCVFTCACVWVYAGVGG